MNPDRLRKFIDSPSVANAARNIPVAIVKRQTQVTSWNGEQCDVRAFENKERHSTCDVIGTQRCASDATRIRGEAFKSDLLSHNATGATGREYQSKNCNANPRLQHHDRLFNETPLEWNQQRAQNLRNQVTGGRSYDIVNGGRVEHFPPTIPEKQHQWQTHPSVSIHPYTR
ncbi:hypothetical protein JG687_00008138 [Phytophthora cactorum]|uniref:Uncharacterized protein n=1 Tax=Phytophthora cactorum TaxID=29920 RepID=A0A8T1UHU2_9STRA|nr:hypothetical protein JG687_00008138 [Phytophthora cactorum]